MKDKLKQAKEIIRRLREQNTKQHQIIEDNILLKRMLVHELINPLNNIIGFADLIKEENNGEYIQLIEKSADYMSELISTMRIGEFTKKEIKKYSERINIEKLVKDNLFLQENLLKKEKLKFELYYNKNLEEVNFNKETLNMIYNTLLGNALNYSIENSKIKQTIKINRRNNLEIIIENSHNGEQIRKVSGTNQRIGIPYVKKIMKILGGTITKYSQPKIKEEEYDKKEIFGYQEEIKEEDKDIWGTKIEIPL